MVPSTDVEQRDSFFNIEAKITEVEDAISQNIDQREPEKRRVPPKIQRVPKHLRERDLELHQYSGAEASTTHHDGGATFRHHDHDPKHQNKVATKYYTPKMISIGPIHHNLKLGEKHKLRWTARYLIETEEVTRELYQRIKDNIEELKKLFAEEVILCYSDDYLAWMLFTDGCSLLYFVEHCHERNLDKYLEIKYDQLIYMSRDLILLENQLPYQVLVLLSKKKNSKGDWLESVMAKYVEACIDKRYFSNQKPSSAGDHSQQGHHAEHTIPVQEEEPIHLLHFVRKHILQVLGLDQRPEEIHGKIIMPTYKNIRDLKAAKIGLKKSRRGRGISFSPFWVWGNLQIPKFRVDDSTAVLVLNMIAYEMCPDFQNGYELSSFVGFLEFIIDDAEDVKELRKAGIMENMLGSDEEVAQLFNAFSSDLVVEDMKYLPVKQKIERHYQHTCRIWIAEFLYDHFSTPWTLLAFLAAVIALCLSGIQTFFSAFPRNEVRN